MSDYKPFVIKLVVLIAFSYYYLGGKEDRNQHYVQFWESSHLSLNIFKIPFSRNNYRNSENPHCEKIIIRITDDSYGASQHQGELQKIKVNTKLWLSYHIDK